MRVAFTGHRPGQLNIDGDERSERGQMLRRMIRREIAGMIKAGADTFLCGAAMGADIICGELVLAEKQTRHPELKLVCAIPFKEQADRWPTDWKERYRQLLKGADGIVHVCDSYQNGCYHIRNRYLVDHADTILAIYNGMGRGGTAYTVEYARQQGRNLVIINPVTLMKTIISTE